MKKKSSHHMDEEAGFPYEEYLEEPESPGDYHRADMKEADFPQLLAGSFEERIRILREAIEEIDLEIGVRERLNRDLAEAFKRDREWLSIKLSEFDKWQFGYKPSVDFRRTALERELLGIYRESRTEKHRRFSDIASLRKERRKLLMEYKSLKATKKGIEPAEKQA